jgi:hypothetical protein
MKKIVLLILALLLILPMAACNPVDPGYSNTVAYAGWSDDPSIVEGAVNRDLLQNGNGEHLPIFKLDTIGDLDRFKAKYGEVFSLRQGYDQVLSFEAVLEKSQCDDADFYAQNTLLIVYVPSNSGSYRYYIDNVDMDGNDFCIYVKEAEILEENVTGDMEGWFVLFNQPKNEVKDYTTYNARISN